MMMMMMMMQMMSIMIIMWREDYANKYNDGEIDSIEMMAKF